MKIMGEKDYTFFNTTKQSLSLVDVVREIVHYVGEGFPDRYQYRIIVSTDTLAREGKGEIVTFVTAIVIHQIGHGARFFASRTTRDDIYTFRDRIYLETIRSITLAQELRSRLKEFIHEDYLLSENFMIDADVGENGKSKVLVREIIGLIVGNGFNARVKPEGIGVYVADKFVRPVSPRIILKPT